jgi:hypothetical protein
MTMTLSATRAKAISKSWFRRLIISRRSNLSYNVVFQFSYRNPQNFRFSQKGEFTIRSIRSPEGRAIADVKIIYLIVYVKERFAECKEKMPSACALAFSHPICYSSAGTGSLPKNSSTTPWKRVST